MVSSFYFCNSIFTCFFFFRWGRFSFSYTAGKVRAEIRHDIDMMTFDTQMNCVAEVAWATRFRLEPWLTRFDVRDSLGLDLSLEVLYSTWPKFFFSPSLVLSPFRTFSSSPAHPLKSNLKCEPVVMDRGFGSSSNEPYIPLKRSPGKCNQAS